jgi:hypothetical protein
VFVSYVKYERYTPHAGPGGSDFTDAWQDNFWSLDYGRWSLQNAPADPTAMNNFGQDNVGVRDGHLVLSFTQDDNRGFHGTVPRDPSKPH